MRPCITTNNLIIMEKKESIEQILDQMDQHTIRKSKTSPVLSAVLIVIGIAFIMLNGKMPGASEGGILSPLSIVVGVLLLVWGVVSIFTRKMRYVFVPGKQAIVFRELFFDIKERDRLVRVMAEGKIDEVQKLKPAVNDALKLRIASTSDGNFCYSQIVAYIPFEFVNVNEALRHTPEETLKLLALAKERK